jgi:elongation factor Ts
VLFRSEEFGKSANEILEVAVKNDIADLDALMALVGDMVTEKSGQTGEKVELPFYARVEAPFIDAYVHTNKKLGSMVGFNKAVPAEVAHDVCMQATAMAPVSIDEKDVPAAVLEKEREIGREQARQEGKPEAMLDKIAEGKLAKFIKENTLLNQSLVKDPKVTVGQFIKNADKDATVVAYKRFSLND